MKVKKIIGVIPFLAISVFVTGCNNKEFKFTPTKVAVFADNQLVSYTTSGNTANAIPFLKYHLKMCKAENVDVIMIPGDLTNNAVESYYGVFETALKEVYGDDQSQYPEFVYSMGNHEWWDTSENITSNCIELFNKHARVNTKNLVKSSESVVAAAGNSKAANYYKVINGIPFVAISGSNASGFIDYSSQDEIKSWMKDISKLPSVKAGGPIFMGYHYAMKDTYTFGQGSSELSSYLDNIIKDYPQVVLFSGDTHFAGANERTINQVNYTTINLGSSSYTRHVCRSATMKSYEVFYNIAKGNSSKDVLDGDVAVNMNNTPHIHIVNIDENGNTNFKRYFSAFDPVNARQLGMEWNIPAHITKDKFTYTNDRFENTEWAEKLYGKKGLEWADGAKATSSYNGTELTVKFPDVIDFNYCEHYRVLVTGKDETLHYDFVSHYYKWEELAHNYTFKIADDDLPAGTEFTVKVEAYDFFDNVSLNSL